MSERNLVEFIFRADGRSMIHTLVGVAKQSEKTTSTLKRNSQETATVYEHLGRSTIALRESMSGLVDMVGLGGLAFGLKDAVEGGLSLQASQAQLQQALKQTGQASGDADKRLNEFAEGLSTRGGFSTEQNISALTAFTRETHSAARAQQLLSLSTDIARGRGMDLASAQSVVSRAYTGQIGRLQQLLGPMVAAKNAQFDLTQAHKEEIAGLELQSKAYGKQAGEWLRQQEILRGITPQMQALATLQDKSATSQQIIGAAETVFGGATTAYASKTQGKVSDLQHQLQNLADTTGERLLPMVNYLAKDLTWVVGAFSKLPAPLQATIVGATALGVVLGPLHTAFNELRSTAEGAGRMLGLLKTDAEEAAAAETRLAARAGEAGAAETVAAGEGAGAGAGVATASGAAGGAGVLSRLAGGLNPFLGVGAIGWTLAASGAGNPLAFKPGEHPVGYGVFTPEANGGYTTGGRMSGLSGFGAIQIHPQTTVVKIDGRTVAQAVTQYALQRAARGPTSLSGGSLVTGAPGLPH